MTTYEDGFLSKSIDEVRSIVHEQYGPWVTLFYATNRSAVQVQHALVIDRGNPVQLYAAALYARTLSSIQGAVIVLEKGMEPQARTLLRMALEAFFALAAIAKQPNIVQRLHEAHGAEQRRVAKNMKRWQSPELQSFVQKHLSAGTFEKFLHSEDKEIKALDLAKVGGYEDFYRTVYMVFSWSAHSAPTDLERHLVKDGQGKLIELRNEAEFGDQIPSWCCAIELLIKSQEALAEVFSTLDVSHLKKAKDALHGLSLA